MFTRRLLCVFGLLVLLPPVLWAAPAYTLTDLGPVLALGLDEDGTVVGSTLTPSQEAALLTPQVQPLTTLGGLANGLARGRVVGYSQFDRGGPILVTHAFRWTATGGLQDLGTLSDPTLFSAATGIAPRGLVVGYAEDATVTSQPCVWQGLTPHVLPTLGGATGFADAVNVGGIIVGQSETLHETLHATMWVMGFPIDLDTTGGPWSLARAINGQGVVVGDATFATGAHAFVWTLWQGLRDLGTLPGDVTSVATGVNAHGVIVGASTDGGTAWTFPVSRATRWHQGQIVAFDTLVDAPGWTLEWAHAINGAGMIVGQGHVDGEAHAFLLTPILQAWARRQRSR